MSIVSEYYHCTICDEVKVVNRDDQVQRFNIYCDSYQCQVAPSQIVMKEVPYQVYKAICSRIKQQSYHNTRSSWKIPRSSIYGSPYGKGVQQQVSQSNQTKCRLWWDVDLQAYRCSTPYSKEFVEFIKIAIPVSDRAYDPTTKIWAFAEKYLDVISDTARKVWKNPGEVVIITKAQTQQPANSPVLQKQTPEQVLVEFVKLLPVDALIAAYRRASMELHPDKGGSMEKMALLNMYWDRIKQDKQIK